MKPLVTWGFRGFAVDDRWISRLPLDLRGPRVFDAHVESERGSTEEANGDRVNG